MFHYPQLSTGTLAQYPLRKTQLKRTIINNCLDSRTVKLSDPAASLIAWDLDYAGLTEAEWLAMKTLFLDVEGRLRTFVFLDPTDNLLRFSETLSSSVWQKDGLITLATGIADPLGGTRATRLTNSAAITQSVSQTVPAAGWFRYCFSVYVRSSSAGSLTLTRSTADGQESRTEIVGPVWRRLENFGEIAGSAEEIEFELSLPVGAVVDIFGLQAEAQTQPSAYKKTESQAGVYPATRFSDDALSPIAVGLNDFAMQIQLVSKTGS